MLKSRPQYGIGSTSFLISILLLGFKVNSSNHVYEVNISIFLKKLNNVKSCKSLDLPTLNLDVKMNLKSLSPQHIHYIFFWPSNNYTN
jgi:hypothetical protein